MNILTPESDDIVWFCVTPLQLERKNEFGVKFPNFTSFHLVNGGVSSVSQNSAACGSGLGIHEQQM